MKKTEAVFLFNNSVADLAAALGITRHAIYQWPDKLKQEQVDRVTGAAMRLGKIKPAQYIEDSGCIETGEPTSLDAKDVA